MAKLVYNIEPASPSMITSLDRHCVTRVPDGSSNIIPARSHLNQILEGDEQGLNQSLKNFYATGVKKPATQSEKPYLRLVLSASPEYFRPEDPEAVGTWDEDRLAPWVEASMAQLRKEHGADLVFAELHLDEDTPHIHAVVAPTYLKKARKPGRAKRGETPEQFEARKALALASEGIRTVGRASHDTLSKMDSFRKLRERMTAAVDHLGIEYGEDRSINAPAGQSTREWVIQQAAQLRRDQTQLQKERKEFEEQKRRAETELKTTIELVEIGVKNLHRAVDQVQAGTYDTEIFPQDMADQPQKFAVLQAAAPDNRPTLGFRNRFWSLNFSNGSGPMPLPLNIRTSFTKAFDRVASWAVELREARLEAERVLTEARDTALRVLGAAEESADQLMDKARQRAAEWESTDARSRSHRSYIKLITQKIIMHFGEDGLRQVKSSLDEVWPTHPDNPNRPAPQAELVEDTSSGPDGP